jgi:hypothetical protein
MAAAFALQNVYIQLYACPMDQTGPRVQGACTGITGQSQEIFYRIWEYLSAARHLDSEQADQTMRFAFDDFTLLLQAIA